MKTTSYFTQNPEMLDILIFGAIFLTGVFFLVVLYSIINIDKNIRILVEDKKKE